MNEIDRWEERKLRAWKRRGRITKYGQLRNSRPAKRLTPKQLAASNPQMTRKQIAKLYEFLYGERPRGRGAKG